MGKAARWTALVAATALMTSLGMASTSWAYGPCGVDDNGSSACPLALSPTSVSATLANGTERDYYVFSAYRRTTLSLTINNDDNPACSFNFTCADVSATLLYRDGAEVTNTQVSSPQNGIEQPQSISPTIGRGIYYVTINGFGSGSFPAPYTLSINAATSPAIHWPPLCQVPKLQRNTRLGRVKVDLTRDYCLGGRVHHAYSNHTRRGRVIGLRPHFGAVEPYQTMIPTFV
jgi:hypothetical protein